MAGKAGKKEMEFLFEWVKNLAVCMILFSTILHILPKSHFEKYIRFYTGLLVLILVIRPLLYAFSLDTSLVQKFQHYMEQMEDDSLKRQMEDVDKKRKEGITDQLEDQVKKQVIEQIDFYGKDEGVKVSDCQVAFDMEEKSETYGEILRVSLLLEEEKEEGKIEPPVVILGERIEVSVEDVAENEAEEANVTGEMDMEKKDKIEERVRKKVADMISIDQKQVSVSFDS